MAGEKIEYTPNGTLSVPDQPVIPYVEGDGVGRRIEGGMQIKRVS